MHTDRLERLAKLLEADAANEKGARFDLGCWAIPSTPQVKTVYGERTTVWAEKLDMVPMDCGTTACALGLAAISGEFKAEGLTCGYTPMMSGGFTLVPTMGDYDGFHAARKLFGISYEDAQYLFDPDCYDGTPEGAKGERFVAQRIRDFANGTIDKHFHPDTHDED